MPRRCDSHRVQRIREAANIRACPAAPSAALLRPQQVLYRNTRVRSARRMAATATRRWAFPFCLMYTVAALM
eukprot:8755008-Pyramimonas_sp.AAC.1